jgi:cation diffusion facilitator CzcD-associated flavoprotein CzcO
MTERSVRDQVAEYDAIVIGAGISGMYMLYRLRKSIQVGAETREPRHLD